MILTIGFIIGLMTGLKIPEEITFGYNEVTADLLNSSIGLTISYYEEQLKNCELNKTLENIDYAIQLETCKKDLNTLIFMNGCKQQKTTSTYCDRIQGECFEEKHFIWICQKED